MQAHRTKNLVIFVLGMAIFTLKTQTKEYYEDQFDTQGEIVVEEDLLGFNEYANTGIFKYKSLVLEHVSSVCFEDSDGPSLQIWSSLREFTFQYDNGKQYCIETISRDVSIGYPKYSILEIIKFFFEEDIETKLRLEDIREEQEVETSMIKYKISTKRVLAYFWYNIFIAIVIMLLLATGENVTIFYPIAFSILLMHQLLMLVFYWYKNRGTQVFVDFRNHRLRVIQDGKDLSFKRSDVDYILTDILIGKSDQRLPHNTKVFLKSGERVYLSCILIPSDRVISCLDMRGKWLKSVFPI